MFRLIFFKHFFNIFVLYRYKLFYSDLLTLVPIDAEKVHSNTMKTNAYKIDKEVSNSIFLDNITSSMKCKTSNTLLVSSL